MAVVHALPHAPRHGFGFPQAPAPGLTPQPVHPHTDATVAPSGWLLPGAGCPSMDGEHGKWVGTQWEQRSKTTRQRHDQPLSPAALVARNEGTDHRCRPGAARCRASLRTGAQLGDVSGAVRRRDHQAAVGGRVRGAGKWRSSTTRFECDCRGTAIMNREDRELRGDRRCG